MKCAWSGSTWDARRTATAASATRASSWRTSATPPRTLEPGEYRAYLAPAALDELLWMLNWGGVSEKAQRTKQSCIQKLVDGEAALLAAGRDRGGHRRRARAGVRRSGVHEAGVASTWCSTAGTAAAWSVRAPARSTASRATAPAKTKAWRSMAVGAGTLREEDVLAALGTGLYVGNLHYLNFSDRANGRVTGMTRFATFWVEDGRIAAPRERDALGRHAVPDARRQPRGADRPAAVDPRQPAPTASARCRRAACRARCCGRWRSRSSVPRRAPCSSTADLECAADSR